MKQNKKVYRGSNYTLSPTLGRTGTFDVRDTRSPLKIKEIGGYRSRHFPSINNTDGGFQRIINLLN